MKKLSVAIIVRSDANDLIILVEKVLPRFEKTLSGVYLPALDLAYSVQRGFVNRATPEGAQALAHAVSDTYAWVRVLEKNPSR